MTDLLKKLGEVLEKDKAAEMEAGVEATAPAAVSEDQVRKVRKAEEQVAYLSELFMAYVMDTIEFDYPGVFKVERMSYRQASRKPEIFGALKPSAEHRVVATTFKNEYFMHVRFSALILSRELEVVAYFSKRGHDAKVADHALALEAFRDGPAVDWKRAFESLFLAFLTWYERKVF